MIVLGFRLLSFDFNGRTLIGFNISYAPKLKGDDVTLHAL